MVPVWADALKNVDQSLQHIKTDAPRKVYALPEPALFVTPSNNQKKISYLMTWLGCQPAWLWCLESKDKMAVSSQMWRDLLGTNFHQRGNDQTAVGKRHEQMQKLIGHTLDKPGLSLSTSASQSKLVLWRGQQLVDNVMPPLRIVHEILWEIYELSFRYELLALNRRLSPEPELDQPKINACFPASEGGLTFVMPSAGSSGLLANHWHSRFPYVTTFVRIMRNWNVPQLPSAFQIVESRPESITEQQVLEMERAAVYFYTQLFFDYFGRAPIVPHRLLD